MYLKHVHAGSTLKKKSNPLLPNPHILKLKIFEKYTGMRQNLKWHCYYLLLEVRTIDEFLAEVVTDPHHCFLLSVYKNLMAKTYCI
jgi:hypothetical protein